MSKTVFITGGSGGIGSAAVRAFSEAGYNVAFTYNKNETAAKELSADIPGSISLRCDVTDGESVKTAVNAALTHFGKIDVLINNAGIAEQILFTDITENRWDKMLDTNLKSCFLTAKAVIPQMISRKSGAIINVSSMWGITGASCEVHYSAAKSGVIGLTKALAKELGPSGIRVNAVAPGVIDTPMNSHLDENAMSMLKEEIPLGKIGRPEEVAGAMLFLAENGYITGQVITVDGGMVS